MIKNDAFDILDDWDMVYGDIHENKAEAAVDLADELDVPLDEAQRLVNDWIRERSIT